jgi:thiol-disulfide isomerase/thioredoxin
VKAPANTSTRLAALTGWIWIAVLCTPTGALGQSRSPDSLPRRRLPVLVTPGPDANVPLAPMKRRVTDYARPLAVVMLGGPWCKPCPPLYDSLSATASRLQGGRYGFAYVSFDDDPWKVWRSVRLSGGIRAPVLFGGDHWDELDHWGVTGVPWLFLIDATGRVLDRAIGTRPGLALLQRVEASPADRDSTPAVAP